MRRLSSILCCFFAGLVFAGAGSTQDKGKDAPKTAELHKLEKDGGANFGDWAVWNYQEGGAAIFLVNQKTGYAIYLPWSSNGWINFRPKEGDWHVLYSKGEPELQERKNLQLAKFLDKRPTLDLEPGLYTFKDWNVKITKDLIEFSNAAHDDRLTIRRTSGEFVHNGLTIPKK